MTWRKTGTEFDDQCADVGLTDEAYRTHQEAIGYIYKTETRTCLVSKTSLRRFATSHKSREAVQELLDHGFWADRGTHYEVQHHADVIRDSLDAQTHKRDRDREAQRRTRERKEKSSKEGESPKPVSDVVSADTRQTDRQTDKQLGAGVLTTCRHRFQPDAEVDPWLFVAACDECQDQKDRRSA